MSKIVITDYVENPDIERKILGNLLGSQVSEQTEVLLVWHQLIDKIYINRLPNLRGVQRYGVGYDNIDTEFLKSQDIVFCNNPDYGVDEVSDTAVAMILNIARGVTQYNQLSKAYTTNWQENINTNIKRNSEIKVGIVGAGRIGGSVILKCNALKFQTIFYDKYKESGVEKLLSSKRVDSLEGLLTQADIISLHLPMNNETSKMIDEKFIDKMKHGASIVNTARGGLFKNLDVLYKNLKSNKIYQLAIDVLPDEPPKKCKFINAWRNSEEWINGRVIINPHTSYYSQESYKEMRIKAAENALRIYKNLEPHNRIC